MGARQELKQAMAARYRRAKKKGKGRILNEFCDLTGYNRCYAGLVLRNYGKPRRVGRGARAVKLVAVKRGRKRRGRPGIYGVEVEKRLKGLWGHFNFLCGKRMEPTWSEWDEVSERNQSLSPKVGRQS